MIAAHVRLAYRCQIRIAKAAKAADNVHPAPVVKWKPLPVQGCSRLTVVSSDRPKLLASVAGALASQNINVIGADGFFRTDGLVLDIFRVCTTNFEPVTAERTIKAFEKSLNRFLNGDFVPDFDAIAKKNILGRSEPADSGIRIPQRVYVNNDTTPEASVIEIQTLDRLGLLYDIFTVIADQELEITNSRISTTRGAAIDSFYVVDKDGKKITDREQAANLEKMLADAIWTKP